MKYEFCELLLIWLDSFLCLDYNNKKYIYDILNHSKSIKNELLKFKDNIINKIGEDKYNIILTSSTNEYFSDLLNSYNTKKINILTFCSNNYPINLKNISEPPLVLYAKGNLELLNKKLISVVGSRKSLPMSVSIAKNYVKEFCACNYTVVTGLAEGIDSAVVESAFENNGNIISVLACGFEKIYPSINKSLSDKIAANGLLLSEYPPETNAMPFYFPVRNRIIAALSKATVIISAGKKSGAIYTAEYAQEYGKDLFVVPFSPNIESGVGCNELIKNGAMLSDSAKDVLDFYGEKRKNKIPLNSEEKIIVDLLKQGQMHIEKICEKTKKQIFEITPILSILEIKGIVVKAGSNVFGLVTSLED